MSYDDDDDIDVDIVATSIKFIRFTSLLTINSDSDENTTAKYNILQM